MLGFLFFFNPLSFPLLYFSDLLHPYSIDIFEDYIYGVTYVNNVVFRVNKFGKGPMENLTTGINHATDIVLYHRYKQPESAFCISISFLASSVIRYIKNLSCN